MPPLMGHFIGKSAPLQPSDYGGDHLLLTSTQTIAKDLLDSKSSSSILRSGLENLKTNSEDFLSPVKNIELLSSGTSGPLIGSGLIQSSSTLMPPDCVTADSPNELLRKICDVMGPDDRTSTKDHIYVDSGWSIVIGGIIFFALFMLVLAMVNKTIALSTKRGNTLKSIDRPSTCEEPFDDSYQLEKSLPPGEVKFQLGPGSDEDDWTDSWSRKEYAPLVHYPTKKKKQPTYRTF